MVHRNALQMLKCMKNFHLSYEPQFVSTISPSPNPPDPNPPNPKPPNPNPPNPKPPYPNPHNPKPGTLWCLLGAN